MGLLRKLLGGKGTKLDLIKGMAKFRMQNDPWIVASGLPASTIDKMSEVQIMGLPEATIATIVETYTNLRQQGSKEEDIFELIETHRSRFGKGTTLPSPPNLYSYTKYRVKLDHPDFIIGEDIFEELIDKALQFFR